MDSLTTLNERLDRVENLILEMGHLHDAGYYAKLICDQITLMKRDLEASHEIATSLSDRNTPTENA